MRLVEHLGIVVGCAQHAEHGRSGIEHDAPESETAEGDAEAPAEDEAAESAPAE